MNILMIGGPKFLGRHITTAALAAGHNVTHFNRGNYPADDFPEVGTIRGDRYRDLDKLKGQRWDAVIDTCGYIPQNLKEVGETLSDSVDRYVFISSLSAYASYNEINFNEDAPLAALTGEQKERLEALDLTGEITAFKLEDMYGALKAECEQAVEAVMPGRVVNVRSGLIVGPYDTTDRFTYWVMRTANGGEVVAPGSPDRFVQLIDARDMSEWIIRMIERGGAGTFNVTGKPLELTMRRMLTKIKDAAESDATFFWAHEKQLAAENIQPWSEMPLYLPESDEDSRGFLSANIDRALDQGLTFRPLDETIKATLEWAKTHRDLSTLKAGISREREAELLKKWK